MTRLTSILIFTCFFLCACFIAGGVSAQDTQLSGTVRDSARHGLAGVSVTVEGAGLATASNSEGRFTIKLKPGKYVVLFTFIGFQNQRLPVTLPGTAGNLQVFMHESAHSLREVSVTAKGENPAVRIMRAAIARKSWFYKNASSWSSEVYIKGIQRLKDAPAKFFGQDIGDELKNFGLDSGKHGILYLSESVSQLSVELPSHIHEEVISSKVSGQSRSFSFNQASDLMTNLNQNQIRIGRSVFISPLADNALNIYHFTLRSHSIDEGHKIFCIRVSPRRKGANLFEGDVYIQDTAWALTAFKLKTAQGSNLPFVDTFEITQQMHELAPGVFLPVLFQLHFAAGIFKFKFQGDYLETFSKYKIKPVFAPDLFSMTQVKITTGSNKKDSSYWNGVRPVPLSLEEKGDYIRKDSIFKRLESKPFLDSMDRKHNKISPLGLVLGGQTFRNSFKKQSLELAPLGFVLSYNTVEGLAFNPAVIYRKITSDTAFVALTANIRYGFVNKRLNPWLRYTLGLNTLKHEEVSFSGGYKLGDQNSTGGIDPLYNTYQTLFNKENILKLYEKHYLSAEWKRDINPRITIGGALEFARRIPLLNSAYAYISGPDSTHFTSNGPYGQSGNLLAFEANDALTLKLNARIAFGEKFVVRPDRIYSLGSNYPVLLLTYRKGIKAGTSTANYDFLAASLGQHNIQTGTFGEFNYNFSAGKFINRKSLTYLDFEHFTSSGASLQPKAGAFELLNTYRYSASDYYLHAHIEQNLKGALFSRLPLLRKAHLEELLGASYLRDERLPNYTELYFGIERFGIRLAYTFTYIGSQRYLNGFTFSLGGF